MRICLSDFKVTVHTQTHTLTITCICCYGVINGIPDLKIYSHADSPRFSLDDSDGVQDVLRVQSVYRDRQKRATEDPAGD